MSISRRNFLKGAAAGAVSIAALGLVPQTAPEAAAETMQEVTTEVKARPTSPVDGKYVTKALGHES